MLTVDLRVIGAFIVIDIFKLNQLWNENFLRRSLHHLQNLNYDRNKIPFIKFVDNILSHEDIKNLKQVANDSSSLERSSLNQTGSCLSRLFGGQYSKKASKYYNDFDRETQSKLDEMGDSLKEKYERLIGQKLFLGESDFRCCMLRYEGKNTNFAFHYDTEESNCYRSIILFHAKGKVPPFSYYDEKCELHHKDISIGSGLFFQGTKTYHAVQPSNDENMERYIVGWQYSTDLSVKALSYCSELRGKSVPETTWVLVKHSVIINSLLVFAFHQLLNWMGQGLDAISVRLDVLIMVSILIGVVNRTLCSTSMFPKNMGTGLYLFMPEHLTFLFGCVLCCALNPMDGLLLYDYVMLTEMLLPKSVVGQSLKRGA